MSADNPQKPTVDSDSAIVNIGNASNPAQLSDSPEPGSQLLNEKAEKYLREVASIEDLPDAKDQEEMDKTLNKEKQANK